MADVRGGVEGLSPADTGLSLLMFRSKPSALVRSGCGRVGSRKRAIELNDIAIGITQMGRTHSPRRSILRSGDRRCTALDEIGIGGVHIIHVEHEHCWM